jgi:hypothetical protein
MSTPIPDPSWRDTLWRFTEVSNALMALSMGATAVKIADATVGYLYRSNCTFKSISSKVSTAERLGTNVVKALGESEDLLTHLGAKEAIFTLSSKWRASGYIWRGPSVISFAPGGWHSSSVSVKVRFEVVEYTFTLEGKKDKSKDKSPPIDYPKLATAITTGIKNADDKQKEPEIIEQAPEEAPKEKKGKQEIKIKVLENASIMPVEGAQPSIGYGTKLELSGDIYVGRDGKDPDSCYYEFRITWSETPTTAPFVDTISIKCYVSGKVEVSDNFYQACATAGAVKSSLTVDTDAMTQLVADEFVIVDKEKDPDPIILRDDAPNHPVILSDNDTILLPNSAEESSSDDDSEISLIRPSKTDKLSKPTQTDKPGEKTPLLAKDNQ